MCPDGLFFFLYGEAVWQHETSYRTGIITKYIIMVQHDLIVMHIKFVVKSFNYY